MNSNSSQGIFVRRIQDFGSESIFRMIFVPGLFGDVDYYEPFWKKMEHWKCELIAIEDTSCVRSFDSLESLSRSYHSALRNLITQENDLITVYVGFCGGGAVSHACALIHQKVFNSKVLNVLISSPPSPNGSLSGSFDDWVNFMYGFLSGGAPADALDLNKKIFRVACFLGYKKPDYNETLRIGREIVNRSLAKYIACETYIPTPIPRLLYLASSDTGREGYDFWSSKGCEQSSFIELGYLHENWIQDESLELLASGLLSWCAANIEGLES